MNGPDPELEALRDQLAGAQDAARNLAREAAAAAGRRPPPAGWTSATRAQDGSRSELAALLELAEGLRAAVPAELWNRLVAALRELLLALRAVLDLGLARLEARPPASAEVEDIPIL